MYCMLEAEDDRADAHDEMKMVLVVVLLITTMIMSNVTTEIDSENPAQDFYD